MTATFVLALVVLLVLEWAHALNDPWVSAAERLEQLPRPVLAVSGVVVWGVVGLLHAVTGRLWLTTGLTLAATGFVAFAAHAKMSLRSEPLFPTDVVYLRQAGLLVESIGTGTALALIAAMAAAILVTWQVARLVRRPGRRRSPTRQRRRLVAALRVVAGLVAGVVVVTAATFNVEGNPLRDVYGRAGAIWAPWSQLDNYAKNGFVAGALYNLPATAMDEPPGYGPEAVAEVVERYRAAAVAANVGRDEDALADTNVVLVLAESTADPTRLDGVDLAEDPLPFLHELMADNSSGTLLVSGYGGGTANVEFEALTGLAVASYQAQVHSPFQMLVSRTSSFPSYLDRFADRPTLALHPYVGEFYQRHAVYPALGFDRAEFRDTMTQRSTIEDAPFVSDAAVFRELVDELRAEPEPMLVNVVTMQNHVPHRGYSDPVPVEGSFSAEQAETLGQYVRGLQHSDAALAELAAELDRLPERTVVVYYGDHLAPIWPAEVLAQNDRLAQYSTPWVVFANFETEPVRPEHPISPNLLVPQLIAATGAPLTPLDALLAEVQAEVPALGTLAVLDGEGRVVPDVEALGPRAQEVLADYRLLQYDLTVGAGYSRDAVYTVP